MIVAVPGMPAGYLVPYGTARLNPAGSGRRSCGAMLVSGLGGLASRAFSACRGGMQAAPGTTTSSPTGYHSQ